MATQTLLTHEKMISNLIGDFSPAEHPELFKAGFHYVADLISTDSELWTNQSLKFKYMMNDAQESIVRGGDGSGTGGAQKVLKIISVWRKSGDNWKQCKEISWKDYSLGEDYDSIYSHRNSSKNPVWSIKANGKLYISPAPTEIEPAGYRFWSVEPADFFGINPDNGEPFESYHIASDLFGFPREAQLAAVIKSAMNILQVKMGEAVHEDEDSELLQLQQAQFAQLGQWFESELSRLNIQSKKVGISEE
jgi:hypothetical protein